jgi:hypothetical protein
MEDLYSINWESLKVNPESINIHNPTKFSWGSYPPTLISWVNDRWTAKSPVTNEPVSGRTVAEIVEALNKAYHRYFDKLFSAS